MEPERKLLAIISGDVAGYSRLMAEFEDETIASLTRARGTIGSLVVSHNGRLVDFAGDNFLAEFASAVHAVECAVAIQRSFLEANADTPRRQRMLFRLGAHVGDVRVEGDRLFGDGINIASRLEGLADPGGICLSKSMLDLMGDHISVSCRPGGSVNLKGFSQEVDVYYVFLDAGAKNPDDLDLPTDGSPHALDSIASVPTIAVLPFENLSADSDHVHIANAITGDVISGLSCDKRMSVIAYNSVARFAGTSKSVQEIGRALGAQYLSYGNVRVSGSRIRVAGALVDVESELEIWGGKRDVDAQDLFEAMDEIVEAMVIALASHLRLAESDRFRRKRPSDIEAWRLAVHAAQAFIQNPTDSLDGPLAMAEEAVHLDPNYAFAWAVLGFLTAFKFPMGISSDHPSDVSDSLNATHKALALDPRDPMALTAHAIAMQYAGHAKDSLEYLQRSLRLNPNDTLTHCYYGRGMMYSGEPELALAHFERFERLNPDDPAAHMAGMYYGLALMFLQRWERAETVARQANAAAGGRNPWIWATLAIVLGRQGRIDEARNAIQELLAVASHWDVDFVDGFLKECQEDKTLMIPISNTLQEIWPS